MRDHQHGYAAVDAHPANELGDGALVRQVEAVERLVENEQSRVAHEGLRDQQALLFTAGELADRTHRVRRCVDALDDLAHPPSRFTVLRTPRPGQTEAIAVEAEADDVNAAHPQRRVEAAALREVADLAVGYARGLTEHEGLARGERDHAERGFDQGRFPDAVRAEDRDELAGRNIDVDVVPEQPVANADGCIANDTAETRCAAVASWAGPFAVLRAA